MIKRPDIVNATIETFLDQLKSPESWNRHQARNELSLREPERVWQAINRWTENLEESDPAGRRPGATRRPVLLAALAACSLLWASCGGLGDPDERAPLVALSGADPLKPPCQTIRPE